MVYLVDADEARRVFAESEVNAPLNFEPARVVR
jgi:hypothetical protein